LAFTQMFFIFSGCEVFGGVFISLQMKILNKTLIVERRPANDSIHSEIIENNQKECTADCLVACYAKNWQTGCNAIGNDGIRKTAVWRCTLRKWQQEGVQQCKSILFAVYLKEVQITCVLDQLDVDSRSLELHEMQIQWGKSFDECILMCNLLRPENKCNAIKYYQSPMKCFLLAVHINSTTTDAQQKSFSAIFIYGCSRGSYYLHEIKNYSTLVRGGTFISLQILNKTFIIERRPTADSIRSKIIGNHHKSCIADCIFTCHAMTGQSGCNAVIYNPKTRFCTLLKHETPTPPTTFSHHEAM
ncbi:hypothetical protein T4E_7085, partial [Trichinella pseudospiralis]